MAIPLFNRPGAPHPSACQALRYYLDLTSEDANAIPIETRKILDRKAAKCPNDGSEEVLDGIQLEVTAAQMQRPAEDASSIAPLDRGSARMALDELFTLAGKYNSSDAYLESVAVCRPVSVLFPVQRDADPHANAGCPLRLPCSQVAKGLWSGD